MRFFFRVLLITFLFPAQVSAGELEDVLAGYYEARGGLARLQSVVGLKLEGTARIASTETPFKLWVRDGKCRIEILPAGTRIIKILDGTSGWEINPMLGTSEPQRLNEREIKRLEGFLEVTGPLVDWQKKDHHLTYLDKTRVKDRLFHRIRVQTAHGRHLVYYLDADTHLLAMFEDGRGRMKTVSKVTAHIETEGLKFVKRFFSGREELCSHDMHDDANRCSYSKTVTVEHLELNPTLSEDLFCIHAAYTALAHEIPEHETTLSQVTEEPRTLH